MDRALNVSLPERSSEDIIEETIGTQMSAAKALAEEVGANSKLTKCKLDTLQILRMNQDGRDIASNFRMAACIHRTLVGLWLGGYVILDREAPNEKTHRRNNDFFRITQKGRDALQRREENRRT